MRADLLAAVTAAPMLTDGRSVREAFYMFWDTLWALVLGFTDSSPCSATKPAVASRIAACTSRRCASIVSFHSFGTTSEYVLPHSETE
jgi:hypothetical protein